MLEEKGEKGHDKRNEGFISNGLGYNNENSMGTVTGIYGISKSFMVFLKLSKVANLNILI